MGKFLRKASLHTNDWLVISKYRQLNLFNLMRYGFPFLIIKKNKSKIRKK